jgi:FtsP/CotA-like multicopper oxidase with cupredoxin domain
MKHTTPAAARAWRPEHAEVLNRSQAHLEHDMTERPSRHWKTYDVAFVASNPGIWMDHCHISGL